MSDRIFLDANVLWSASYRSGSSLAALWNNPETGVCTSTYAATEAIRNTGSAEHLDRLLGLLSSTEMTHFESEDKGTLYVHTDIDLPDKDWPILLAALDAGCTHLLTGDKKHFGRYFGATIEGVIKVMTPQQYLAQER